MIRDAMHNPTRGFLGMACTRPFNQRKVPSLFHLYHGGQESDVTSKLLPSNSMEGICIFVATVIPSRAILVAIVYVVVSHSRRL